MGGYFINIHHYHVLINYFIIIEVIIKADSTTTPDMGETVCYDSDEEEMTVTLHMLNLPTKKLTIL